MRDLLLLREFSVIKIQVLRHESMGGLFETYICCKSQLEDFHLEAPSQLDPSRLVTIGLALLLKKKHSNLLS